MANFNLLRSNILYMEKAVSEIKGEKNPGDSVTTTLNYDLQLQAYDALGSYDGAVVVDGAGDRQDPCHGVKAGFRSEHDRG